jgi:cation diffusion facilitator family transporter
MGDCGCHIERAHRGQRRILWIALTLNAAMALVETFAGLRAQSTGLLADAIDMLSDAGAYAIALVAISRSPLFKARSAAVNGAVVLLLGIGVLIDVERRLIYGSEPQSAWMIGIAALALTVNMSVLWILRPFRQAEVHLRATWICTRADVVANAGVIASGVMVAATEWRLADLIAGAVIGIYVIKEAIEILREARDAGAPRSADTIPGAGRS